MPIGWDELEDFAQQCARDATASDTLVAPLIVAHDAHGPVAALTVTVPAGHGLPTTHEVVAACTGLLAPLHPTRIAALWQLLLAPPPSASVSVSDDGWIHGLRLLRGETVTAGRPRWTSRVHGYRRAHGQVTAWVADPPTEPVEQLTCPLVRGLRGLLAPAASHRRSTPALSIPGPPFTAYLRRGLHTVGCPDRVAGRQ